MKSSFIFFSAFLWSCSCFGQQAKMDITNNPLLSASNYVAYPAPKVSLTPAPKGYSPFYISHYGRHGSRYLIGSRDYDKPYFTLLKADNLGKLTPLGCDVLEKLAFIRNDAKGRDGELTLLGAAQHKGIAKRMFQNFPEVFAGNVTIDAKSTVVIRCILSMENALQEFCVLNPHLNILHDASYHYMYYMNHSDKSLEKLRNSHKVKEAFDAFCAKYEHHDRLMRLLFNDDSYWKDSINAVDLKNELFSLASNMQSTELRNKISLYSLFSTDELYDNWLQGNAWWYINFGPSPLSGGVQPFSQSNLLRNIISQADSCIALPHPGATLRYGHDTMVMPLTCLLDLDGLGKQVTDLDSVAIINWRNYNIFPMACNIQFVFYRKNINDKDVIFKVLRNEKEARLPIKTDMFPYYRWSDFKKYFLDKLNSSKF